MNFSPKLDEKVITNETLRNDTTGIYVLPNYINNRKPNCKGIIWNIIPGYGGEVWLVRHEDGTDAVYVIDEFESC